ncbi:MAG: nucleotidyltransferase [Lentisphaerae bacterium]|nr:nucleotidyltransferase [Lentisphaerota bacterium]
MDLALVVLAAGIGRRFGGLKQMAPLGPNGEFIIDYSVFDAIRSGFNKIVFLISKDIEMDFRTTIGERVGRYVSVEYAFQDLRDVPGEVPELVFDKRKKPWGTGHALLACKDIVKEPFAVINADDFYGHRSYKQLSEFLRATADDEKALSMVGFMLSKTVSEYGYVSRGVCHLSTDGTLEKIVECTKIEQSGKTFRFASDDGWENLDGQSIVSMNMWGLKPSIFAYVGNEFRRFIDKYVTNPNLSVERKAKSLQLEFFLPSVIDRAIADGMANVKVLQTSSEWFGMTYPEDIHIVKDKLAALIAAGNYPSNLWAR